MLPDEPASESVISSFPSSSTRPPVSRSPPVPVHLGSLLRYLLAQLVTQLTLQNLPGGVAGQFVGEHDPLRLLVAGQAVLAEGNDLGFGHVGARAPLDDGHHVLAPVDVG